MRFLYSILLYLATPFLLFRLFRRAKHMPQYQERIRERFGFYSVRLKESLWIHAVSVGEVIAAKPLIKALKLEYPHLPIVVTTMTPTGADRVQKIFSDEVTHLYFPYDLPDAIARFLNAINPKIAIIMETELWPNCIFFCAKKRIPICLLNARLSERSKTGYAKVSSLTKNMLSALNIVAARSEKDAAQFLALGAREEAVKITGNIKFDLEIPQDIVKSGLALREELGKDRVIWIAASTHAGEEEILLSIQQKLLQQHKNILLILVPRHLERIAQIEEMIKAKHLTYHKRSEKNPSDKNTDVYLADTMGELLLLYAASDISFVGGSLIAHGGHNMLEPAILEKPIITGPHLFNFPDVEEKLSRSEALIKIEDAQSLTQELLRLIKDKNARLTMGARAKEVVLQNQGVLAKQLKYIHEMLSTA